jgi:hypothetical protein
VIEIFVHVILAKTPAATVISLLSKFQIDVKPPQSKKINVDNKVRFRYPDEYCFRLIDASICCAALSRRSS